MSSPPSEQPTSDATGKLPHDNQEATQALPELTPAVVQRVQEGLAAARDRAVRASIQLALNETEAIAKGQFERPVSGEVRRQVLRSLIHSLFQVRVEYAERIPQGPALLAANHLNHIDPFLLLSEVPGEPYYHILADARTLYNKGWKRQVLQQARGVIPVERRWREEIAVIAAAQSDRPDLADLALALERDVPAGNAIAALRQIDRAVQAIFAHGDGLILFPEGGLGTLEGQLRLPLKRGTVIYALRAGVPIVPVALIGTQDLYFRKTLTVRFGEPLQFPPSHRPKPHEAQAAIDALQVALLQLLPQDYQEPQGVKLFRRFLNHLFW
ncbi:MAG: 1-acyl-sn-glycerol-3-phosphate acyltransferase [Trichocoleus desertorum ATA4-8-CV12]|jgi:1-acyl-sn-glycerol-3-phosphate acyltransferase|nr:1-acyl-sn-glycerol-3-phosphate acyltransferase [Trichocoleus desertorum ATA4-8-CV12]